jgi:hypothetical protein
VDRSSSSWVKGGSPTLPPICQEHVDARALIDLATAEAGQHLPGLDGARAILRTVVDKGVRGKRGDHVEADGSRAHLSCSVDGR